jgi:predicted lipoprotein with Yx(FWY)xxD motif
MRRLLATGLLVGLITVAASEADSRPGNPSAPGVRAKVTVRKSAYGRVLFDGRSRALYIFTADRRAKTRCYGACAKAWPPFLVRQSPRAGTGARAQLIGTTRRRDGSLQVTYRGRPLYFYVGDRAGQVLCQDVQEYGGHWYVVTPRGTAVR